jgi:hypothetical protein
MFRTSCFGASPAWARIWTSLTSPSGVVTTRAERIPSRLVSRFSALRTPQGSGIWSWAPELRPMLPCAGVIGLPVVAVVVAPGRALNPVTI